MRKIGLLGGTFDPIHHGHLNLAVELFEKKNLSEVWFIPAALNPHKIGSPPVAMQHRLAMIDLAISEIPYFHLKNVQNTEILPSYTIHMLKYLTEQAALEPIPTQFYLLMGEDTVTRFAQWYLPEKIVQLVLLLIGCRDIAMSHKPLDLSIDLQEAIQAGYTKIKLMDISSTDIRHRLQQGLYCGHLVPCRILEYIHKNHLY